MVLVCDAVDVKFPPRHATFSKVKLWISTSSPFSRAIPLIALRAPLLYYPLLTSLNADHREPNLPVGLGKITSMEALRGYVARS